MKRTDPAHKWTDEEIERIEKEISKEYKQAHEEAVKKTKAYFKDFERKDEKWRELVEAGKVTEKEYLTWRKGQMLVGKRWEGLCETLAEDYLNAAEIAMSICKEHAPEVYAVNHNYTTFECEQGSGMDTSYTLYSRETVERMYREDPKLYHDYGKAVAKDIKEGRQIAWDKKRVKSVLTQAVLQGESIPKITKRLEIITGGDHKAAIRNARTMMTGVQNAGRIDAMKRANDLGIPTQKQWLATVDNRTRHWHRELDGVIKDIDEPFENSVGKIMFPADPEAAGANVYNCRCTLLSAIKGFELDVTDPSVRPMPKLGDMTYEEWKNGKATVAKAEVKTPPITKAPTTAKAMPTDRIAEIDEKIAGWQKFSDSSSDFNDWVKAEEEIEKLKKERQIAEKHLETQRKNDVVARMKANGFFDDGKNFIGQFDVGDLSMDNLEEVESAYNRVFDKIPQLKGKLAGIGEWNKSNPAEAMASTSPYGGIVTFNPKYWRDRTITDTMKDLYKEAKLATKTTEGAAIHEIGHAIDSFLKNRWDTNGIDVLYRSEPKMFSSRFMSKVYKEAGIKQSELRDHISLYSTYSDQEAFAECFAAWITGDKDNKVVQVFGELLEKELMEIK